MNNVIELITFKLKQDVTDQDFLANADTLNQWVKQQPGFEYRSLSKSRDGTWTEAV